MGTTPGSCQPTQFFTVIHPFHPWRGRRIEMLDCQRQWGVWRIRYLNERGHSLYFPASWTDVGPKHPFVEQSQGRAIARLEDLLELAKMVSNNVNKIKPQV